MATNQDTVAQVVFLDTPPNSDDLQKISQLWYIEAEIFMFKSSKKITRSAISSDPPSHITEHNSQMDGY